MSTHQSRLVYDRGARPCPPQSSHRSIEKHPVVGIADALQGLTVVQIDASVHETDDFAVRGQAQVRRESNDSRASGFNAASDFVSGNTAGMDHAPDIEGVGSNAVDEPLPIYSNTSLPTRH
jgi:hypothetical protein